MKTQKMSVEKMKNVLSHVLSREEMKEVMAGSGGAGQCGVCKNQQIEYDWGSPCHTPGYNQTCQCPSGVVDCS